MLPCSSDRDEMPRVNPDMRRAESAPVPDGKHRRTRSRGPLGSADYLRMTRSRANLSHLDKFKIDRRRSDSLVEEVHRLEDVRRGIKGFSRPREWSRLLSVHGETKAQDAEYARRLEELFSHHVPDAVEKEVVIPDFGGVLRLKTHGLSAQRREEVARLLCVLGHNHADVAYSPMIPDLIAVLLRFLRPAQVYKALDAMISAREKKHLTTSGHDFRSVGLTAVKLVKRHSRSVYKHAKALGVNLLDVIEVWMARLFVTYLPYITVLRVLDCYLVEGIMVVYRIVVAIFELHRKVLLEAKTALEFTRTLSREMRTKTDAGALITAAYRFNLKDAEIEKISKKIKVQEPAFHAVPVFAIPHFDPDRKSVVADLSDLRKIWMWLPNVLRIEDPVVKLSSGRDGYDFARTVETLRAMEKERADAFLVIRTSQSKGVVGVFVAWAVAHGEDLGSHSFLFRVSPLGASHWPLHKDFDKSRIGRTHTAIISRGGSAGVGSYSTKTMLSYHRMVDRKKSGEKDGSSVGAGSTPDLDSSEADAAPTEAAPRALNSSPGPPGDEEVKGVHRAWIRITDKSITIGVGKCVAFQLHQALKHLATNSTPLSPSLVGGTRGEPVKITGFEVWGITRDF